MAAVQGFDSIDYLCLLKCIASQKNWTWNIHYFPLENFWYIWKKKTKLWICPSSQFARWIILKGESQELILFPEQTRNYVFLIVIETLGGSNIICICPFLIFVLAQTNKQKCSFFRWHTDNRRFLIENPEHMMVRQFSKVLQETYLKQEYHPYKHRTQR